MIGWFKKDKRSNQKSQRYFSFSDRGSQYGVGLFLLCFLTLLSACSSDASIAGRSSASSTLVVSHAAHASIKDLAAANEVVYLSGSDGSITARQARNGQLIWNQRVLAALPEYLVPTTQVLYDAYDTTATTARVEARQISNGQVMWSQVIPHPLGPGFVTMMVDAGMVYINTIFSQNHSLLYALLARNGQIRWQYPLHGLPMDSSVFVTNGVVALVDNMTAASIRILHGNDGTPLLSYTCSPGSSWHPTVDAIAIYIYCLHHVLQAYSISNGTLLWTASNSSPSNDYWRENQGIIYGNTGTMLQAFRVQHGILLWQAPLPASAFGPSVQNQLVAVMTQDQVVMVYHANNGTLAWKRPLNSDPFASSDTLGYTDLDASGYILFGNQQTISVWRSSDGHNIWHGTTASRIVWQPQVVNNRLYLWQFDGTFEVVDLQSGTVLWRDIV